VVLARPPSEVGEKCSALGMAEQRGCLVHDQLPRPARPSHAIPDMASDDVDRERLQLWCEIPDLEDDQRLVKVHVGRPGKHAAGERTTDVALEAGRDTSIELAGALRQDSVQVAQQGRRIAVGGELTATNAAPCT